MKAVFKKANQAYSSTGDIDNSLKALQQYIGGYIQTLTIPRTKLIIIMDKKSKQKKKITNIRLGRDVIAGDIIITALDGRGNFRDLTLEEIDKAVKFLKAHSCRKQGEYYG